MVQGLTSRGYVCADGVLRTVGFGVLGMARRDMPDFQIQFREMPDLQIQNVGV